MSQPITVPAEGGPACTGRTAKAEHGARRASATLLIYTYGQIGSASGLFVPKAERHAHNLCRYRVYRLVTVH